MQKKMTVQTPSIPSLLRVGLGQGIMIPIREFTKEELQELGKEWTQELVAKSESGRRK